MRYDTLRDRKTGELLDARCAADMLARPFGGLDKVTFAHAVEEMEPAEVRRLLDLPSAPKEFGIAADLAASNMRAALLEAGISAEEVKSLSSGTLGAAEVKALLAKAAEVKPAGKVL